MPPYRSQRRLRLTAGRAGAAAAPRLTVNPDVSVCIANWNCRDLLRGCLLSLRDNPQGVALEIIVVDNRSSDGAAEMVAKEFPQVRLIANGANHGFARANNQAAQAARGQYLFFLNNDTWVPPGTLWTLVDYLEAHPEVGMVGPRLRDARGQFQVSYRRHATVGHFLHRTTLFRWTGLFRQDYRDFRRGDFDPSCEREVDVLMGAAVLIERERFLTWGGWDEEFVFGGEDMELSHRVNRHARVVFLPQAEVLHFGRQSSRLNSSFAAPHIAIGFARYLRKIGRPRWQLLAYKLAVTLDAPVQLVLKSAQYLVRRLMGRKEEAEKTRRVLAGVGAFLGWGWWKLWRA